MKKIEKMKSTGINTSKISFPKLKLGRNEELPDISLIYTGGTIGSKVDYETGGVYMLTEPEELLYSVPEIKEIANFSINPLMSIASEDMSSQEWVKIAKAVDTELKSGARGVVITHGTDTMHYTSAALSFMLSGLNAPVVLTGSQRSTDRGSSDGFMNLICSSYVASRSEIAEVGICMHHSSSDTECSFIRGTKARKMHTSRRDAFKPINDRAIALVKETGHIEYTNNYKHVNPNAEYSIKLKLGFDDKVALVKTYPNSDPEILDFYTQKGYNGIIIEGTGLGHVPVDTGRKDLRWIPKIKDAIDKGLIIGVTSQCIYGRVNTNVYRNLRVLSSAGAIYCEDMTPETSLIKLGWLLGNYKKDDAKKLLNQNISGEIRKKKEIDF
jgi:glutamyl-tRNA(Gln) amidotransferase subunit D